MITKPVKDGFITSGYGYRVLNGEEQFHHGLDISTHNYPCDIFASKAGQIVFARWQNPDDHNAGFGYYVIIKDTSNNDYWFYGHLQAGSCPLALYSNVEVGDKIGVMGSTGSSTAGHLHIEVRPYPWTKGSRRPHEIEQLY